MDGFAVALPHAQQLAAEASKSSLGKPTVDEEKNSLSDVHAGKTYPFHLALSNLLYDPIQVRLSVQRMHVSTVLPTEGGSPEKARRTPSAVSLPTSSSTVAAEAWEYEDDEDMFNVDGDVGQGGRSRSHTVGVLEKRANVTLSAAKSSLERGQRDYKDDPAPSESNEGDGPSKTPTKSPEIKTFAFFTVTLMDIIPGGTTRDI
ncbi:hypothetical protein BYT27DRAFT_7246491 [Phlegmacium glaucopus]|nr:hypothetical protein BYT27DRAFT_7246491 [Phlegmacium glaucopus]